MPRPTTQTVTPTVLDLPGLPDQAPPPDLQIDPGDPAEIAADVEVVVVPMSPATGADAGDPEETPDGGPDGSGRSVVLGPGAAGLFETLGLDPFSLRSVARASGAAGETVALSVPLVEGRALSDVLLVGTGAGTPADLRRAAAALARRCRDRAVVRTSLAAIDPDACLDDVVAGLVLGSFSFHVRSSGPASRPAGVVRLTGLPDDRALRERLDRATARAAASWSARALATVPSNVKDPRWMVDRALAVAAAGGLEATVWDEADLARDGFGGILAVGRASVSPPHLVRLDHTPPGRGSRRAPRVVLVGKGITFDSGGLSLKPADAMVTMKRDMTGSAVVLGVMSALAALGCPLRVTGLMCLAENAVSGDALRPGDVIEHWGGRTTEVTNTDAEGRLVLADGLAYAASELDPAVLVDVATLTGAMKVALGQRTGGLFATDDALADALVAAGRGAGEPVWRMPLTADYEARLASPVADADNAPGGPGATTAALFLQHFTGGLPWAHLDIASVGDSPSDSHEWTAGPTGFGVRLLLDWLCSADPLAGVRGV